ncbi:MAG TPA: hypothetical protein VK638_54555 [Edaphobacter sp.]|jgi:hypothetical protein|nr:hypothetical protein [Edaphobacter sp.]
MSYDLMVFEPDAAPKYHQKFLDWYFGQTKWYEGHSYSDPAITSHRLRNWFLEISDTFPPLNGVTAEDELPEDEASATDYSIGQQIIYAAFAWSKAANAYDTVFNLSAKHGVGFFDVSSSEEEVWLPESSSRLFLAHQKKPASLKDKLWRLFTP